MVSICWLCSFQMVELQRQSNFLWGIDLFLEIICIDNPWYTQGYETEPWHYSPPLFYAEDRKCHSVQRPLANFSNLIVCNVEISNVNCKRKKESEEVKVTLWRSPTPYLCLSSNWTRESKPMHRTECTRSIKISNHISFDKQYYYYIP